MSDMWPKRGIFRDWVLEAKTKAGVRSNAAISPILGISPTSLNKYMAHSSTHRPGKEALKALGDYLGRDYRVLLDDPSSAPVGIDEAEWNGLTEQQQEVTRALVENLKQFEGNEDLICNVFLRAIREAAETGRLITRKP